LWEVRLYNDSVNYEEHVAASLVKIVGSTKLRAYKTTKAAHEVGEAIIGLYEKELEEPHTFALRGSKPFQSKCFQQLSTFSEKMASF
jgi:ATP-dependent Clp protease adapter protein ClpS